MLRNWCRACSAAQKIGGAQAVGRDGCHAMKPSVALAAATFTAPSSTPAAGISPRSPIPANSRAWPLRWVRASTATVRSLASAAPPAIGGGLTEKGPSARAGVCKARNTSALKKALAPDVDHSFVALRVYEFATAPLSQAQLKTLLPGDEALSDSRNNLFACCRTIDHRLVTGAMAAVTHLGAEHRLRHALGKRLQRIFPQLGCVSF